METLKELVSLLSIQKVKQINLITEDSDVPYKIKQLYDKIASGEIKSDEEAKNILYPDNNSDKSYSILKNRLKERLINTLFFIDINQYSKSAYEVALHKIRRNTAAFTLLLDRGKRTSSIELAEKTLKLALKYDDIESVLYLSKQVRKHYTIYAYDKKKKTYYSNLMHEYLDYYQQEIQAENLYQELAHAVLHNLDINEIVKDNQFNLINIVYNQKTNKNYFFNFYAYNALYFIKLGDRKYEELLELTEESIEFYKSKVGFSLVAIFDQLFKKGYALLNLGRIEEALNTFEMCREMGPKPGNISWFNIHAYICMTAILLKKYDYAVEIFNITSRNPNFSDLHETFKEPWLVKEAYLNFIAKLGKLSDHAEALEGKFKIGRFLNEVPLYSKDKRGYNIAILIIQMLFFLMDKKYSRFIDRMDALNQYSYRYLRNDDSLRSNCFVKMILKIPDANYHPLRLKRHVEKFYKTLINTPPNIREQSSNIEIIPYEHLWELVLELLENKK
jgi:hypothetical protein